MIELTQSETAVLKRNIEAYGAETQRMVAAEECAELIQAISKVRRYGDVKLGNLIEEIADVLFCIEQLQIIYNISDDDIYETLRYKIARQEKRLEEEESEIPLF